MYLKNIIKKITWLIFIPVISLSHEKLQNTKCGIDRAFDQEYVNIFYGKKIALITNNASENKAGERSVDVFYKNQKKMNMKIQFIFTPEHGLEVTLSNTKQIKDPKTNIRLFSIYDKDYKSNYDRIKNVDLIVFDIQDIGLRYYTYTTIAARSLIMAKQFNKKIIFLDRVNPLGGEIISGSKSDKRFLGVMTDYFNIPSRYGLTIGELAQYANKKLNINADLKVIPISGWSRESLFNQTDLTWVPPSPRLMSFEQAYLYAIFAPLESTNLSLGLSVPSKKELTYYGAPFVTKNEAYQIINLLKKAKISGLHFSYQEWVPEDAPYKGQLCRGVEAHVTDYHKINDTKTLIQFIKILKDVLGDRFIFHEDIDAMLGQSWVRTDILNKVDTNVILRKIKTQDDEFRKERKPFLIY